MHCTMNTCIAHESIYVSINENMYGNLLNRLNSIVRDYLVTYMYMYRINDHDTLDYSAIEVAPRTIFGPSRSQL